MKTNFILFLCALALFATSCQKKQVAYFQQSSTEQLAHTKKTHAAATTQPVETTSNEVIEAVPTAPTETSASTSEEVVVSNSIPAIEDTPTMTATNSTQPKAKKMAKWKEKAIVKTLERMADKVANKTMNPKTDYNRLGTISGALGLVGLVFLFLGSVAGFLPILGLVMGITALVTGMISSKRADRKGMAIVGIVTGILNILIWLLLVILIGSLISGFGA
jgi:hypothetical protein